MITQPIGRLPANQELRLALGLPLRNPDGLEQLLARLYDPTDAQYHQYLTPDQFTRMFGPSEQDYLNLAEFARTNGLRVVGSHPNRMVLDVAGSVAAIERTFQINLQLYAHPSETRTFFAPDIEPSVPAGVPVMHIAGLNNYVIPRPAALRPVPQGVSGGVPQAGSGPSGSYRGKDFRDAYCRGTTLTGTGQMVGLLEFDGYYAADIAAFQSQTGLPSVPVSNVTMDGFDGTAGGNNVEAALDVEMAWSMAPGLAQIIVYEAGPQGFAADILNRMATDNVAKQLSASWTFGIDATIDQIFKQFAAQGQSYFNASGDGGAYVGAVDSPTDDPYITVVGGTTLSTTGPGGAWVSETVWNWGGVAGATGGGFSTTYPIPSWQRPVSMKTNQGSTTMRNLPDVAAVADNVWVNYNNGGSKAFGGTSCSAPLWAGFTALVNQQAATFGRPPVGFINPAIYIIGLGAGYTTNFHDVTTGNNTNSNSPDKFLAVTGYDLCTGWGTPFGQNLINALAPRYRFPVITNAGASILSEGCLPSNGAIDPGETVTVNFALKNIGGPKTTNLVATLVADDGVLWPSPPQSYGSMSGGSAALSRSFTFTANGSCGSTLTLTLQLQDGNANLGTQTFSFTLGKPSIPLAQSFDGVTPPSLPSDWTTTASNGVSAWVVSSAAHDSGINAAFADEPDLPGIEELFSPLIPITSSQAQLSFRQSFNTEADPLTSDAYDGGVLEIQIGTNAFADILDAGGSFSSGGYNQTISTGTNTDNPLQGRQVWAGFSGGFITTVVNLPASAAGQVIQLRWRFAVDTGNFYGGTGWYIDTVAVTDGALCCNSSADVTLQETVVPDPVAPGQSLTYSVTVTNLGPGSAYEVTVTNLLPPAVVFASGSAGCSFSNGMVLCDAGNLVAGAATNYTFVMTPLSLDPVTNAAVVWSATADPNPTNNTVMNVSNVSTDAPPIVYLQQTNAVALRGGSTSVQASAVGVAPLTYQWLFNGEPLVGATSNTLALTNLQPEQTGSYSVLVTNVNGTNLSSSFQLTVIVPPTIQLSSFDASGTNVTVSVLSVSGLSYTLQYKNALTDTSWTPLGAPAPGTGQVLILQDTNSLAVPSRFYRISAQ